MSLTNTFGYVSTPKTAVETLKDFVGDPFGDDAPADNQDPKDTSPKAQEGNPNGAGNSATVDWEKRYSDLRSYNATTINELKARIQKLETDNESLATQAKNADSKFKVPATDEEMETFEREYPAMAKMLTALAIKRTSEVTSELKSSISSLEEQRKKAEDAAKRATVLKAHPDFAEIIASNEFSAWLLGRSKAVRSTFENSDDPEDIIDIVNTYKELNGTKKTKKDQTAADHVNIGSNGQPSSGGKIWRATEVDRLSARDFEKFEAEIDAAMKEGRFIQDK